METLSQQGAIDLFYGDESRVSLERCVPYGWQFKEEQAYLPSERGGGLNCFALLSRDSRCSACTTEETITAAWVQKRLEAFSLSLRRWTVVVLDNARIHTARVLQERFTVWQERGLFVFFLPAYSPHLNIAEVLWRKLKYEWLRAEDYADKESLCYQVRQALAAVGKSLKIAFGDFRQNTN